MTVAELNARMGAKEFRKWMSYFREEPFGPQRDNLHAGMVTAMIYNANRGKRQRALSASDFMLMTERARMERNTKRAMSAVKVMAEPRRKRKKRPDGN